MTTFVPTALRRPFVLVRFPAIFLSVAFAAMILIGAAAAAPQFRSATGNASTRLALGPTVGEVLTVSLNGPLAADVVAFRDDQLRLATDVIRDLADPVVQLTGSPVTLGGADADAELPAVLASRTDALSRVRVSSRAAADEEGIWLSDLVAEDLRVVAGDTVTVTLFGREITTTVAAVYEDDSVRRSVPYWSSLFAEIPAVKGGSPPPELVLTDQAEFLRVSTELENGGSVRWSFGLRPEARAEMTLERMSSLSRQVGRLERELHDPTVQVGSALQGAAVSSPLSDAIQAAVLAQRAIAGPIQTLALAGVLAAFFGMVAAGVYGVRRRRIEMRSLDAIGIRWGRLAGRGVVEGLAPVMVGGVLGWLATNALIRRAGPSDLIAGDALRTSMRDGVACAALAVVVLGVVTAIAARRQLREGEQSSVPGRGQTSRLWEVPVLVLAAASFYEITTRGTAPVSSTGAGVSVDRLLLLFPILFLAGCAGLMVRGLVRVLNHLRIADSRWPVPLYLASRRLSSAPRVAALLVTASSLAIGVLVYAGTAAGTIRATTEDKVGVAVGADVSASTVGPIFPPPAGEAISTTNVMAIPFVQTGSTEDGTVTVVGVEPDSFADTAFWDPAFSSVPLDELLRRISAPGASLAALVVNGPLPGGERLRFGGVEIPVAVIGEAAAFPGQASGVTVVVSADRLRSVLEERGASSLLLRASYEAWASGPAGMAEAFLVTSGADPGSVVVLVERLSVPIFRALAWSFTFMELIGLVTASVALIGLLLYLQARQRTRELSYALSRRMGLSSRAHRAAVVAELAGLLVSAFVIGTALGLAAAGLVFARLDPLPGLPPAPILVLPGALIGSVAAGVLVCAWGGAWLVHRRAERADVGAVLRYAE